MLDVRSWRVLTWETTDPYDLARYQTVRRGKVLAGRPVCSWSLWGDRRWKPREPPPRLIVRIGLCVAVSTFPLRVEAVGVPLPAFTTAAVSRAETAQAI